MRERVTRAELLLAEYNALKEEQRARIGFRDNLLYATFASLGAGVALALQSGGRPELLLLLPPVCLVLGWTYLVNDEKISAIGRHVREQLAPALAALSAADGEEATLPFGWEEAHRRDSRRVPRKRLQLAVDLLTFCVCPTAAVITCAVYAHSPAALLAPLSSAELAAVGVMTHQIWSYADLSG